MLILTLYNFRFFYSRTPWNLPGLNVPKALKLVQLNFIIYKTNGCCPFVGLFYVLTHIVLMFKKRIRLTNCIINLISQLYTIVLKFFLFFVSVLFFTIYFEINIPRMIRGYKLFVEWKCLLKKTWCIWFYPDGCLGSFLLFISEYYRRNIAEWIRKELVCPMLIYWMAQVVQVQASYFRIASAGTLFFQLNFRKFISGFLLMMISLIWKGIGCNLVRDSSRAVISV